MLEGNIDLSIIVPVYNSEQFLEKCIKSLTSQSIQNIEILLINDGSTDNSLEICNNFAKQDKRIKVFNQKNSGQSKARNVGLSNATGRYITFTDSDDWVDSNYYENLINACYKYNADISCGSIIRERKNSQKFRINYTNESEYTDAQEKINIAQVPNMCYVWNKVYRRAFIEKLKLRFIEGMYYEDVDFVTRAVYYSNKIVTVPNTYYHYWANMNSTVKTLQKSDKKCKDSITSKQYVLDFFKKHNLKSNPKYLVKKKSCIKCFGIPILKTYEWETRKKYYLFGIIPICEKISYA
ncbi:glycosyltransferase [bacterium]|nr:glycosyltransferase [bacterium]